MSKEFANLKIFVLLILACGSLQSQEDKPNFIFILTDDQSYGMMGCTGNSVVSTPNLDQLAEEGFFFSDAHITSAICTPSRISILLSQFERKHGVNFNSGTSVAPEAWADAYPVRMRAAGYYTGWIGKNHAPIGDGGYQSGLMEKSFDYWYAAHGHLTFYPKSRHSIFKEAKADTQIEVVQEGVEDFLDNNETRLDSAIRFLEERPSEQPFMLSVCLNLPHSAGTGSMELRPSDDEIYRTLYRDHTIPLPSNYIAKADIVEPKLPPDLFQVENRQHSYDFVDTEEAVRERLIRQYQAMTGIDRMIGKIRTKLASLNIDDNTVLIFTSDHGLMMGEYGLGGKALCYEKVTHVPLIIYHPQLPHVMASKSDALVQSIDLAPTLLSWAGVPIPDSYQGQNLAPLMAGSTPQVRAHIYTENLWSTHFGNPRCEAVQDHDWKYIRYYANHNLPVLKKIAAAESLGISTSNMLYQVHDPDMAVYRDFIESPLQGEEPVYEELFHLAQDPHELVNLADQQEHHLQLEMLRATWKSAISTARGEGRPQVLRYTSDSKHE